MLFKILAKNTPPSLAAASAALPIEEFAALSALQVALEEVCNIRKVHPSKPLFRPVIEQWPDIWKWLRFHFQHILSPYDGQGAIPGPHVMCDMEKHLTVLIAILGDISIADLSPDGTIDPFSASSDFIHTLVLIWAVNARRALRSPRDDELRKQIALLSVYPAGLLASSDRAEALLTELHALPDLSELFFGLMESFIPDLSSQAKGKHGAPDDSVLSLFAMIMHTLAQVGNGAHIGCSGTVGGSVPAVQMAFNPIAIRVFVLLMTWYPPEHCTKGDAHNIDRFRDAVDGCGAFTFALFDASLASRPVPYIKEGLDSGLLVLCRRLMLIRQCTCGTEICPWSKEVFPPQMASLYQQFIFDVTQHVAKAMMDGYTAIYRSMRTASKRNSRADYWIPGVTGNLQLGCGRGENGWDAFCDIVELSLKERRNFKKLGQSLCDNRQVSPRHPIFHVFPSLKGVYAVSQGTNRPHKEVQRMRTSVLLHQGVSENGLAQSTSSRV